MYRPVHGGAARTLRDRRRSTARDRAVWRMRSVASHLTLASPITLVLLESDLVSCLRGRHGIAPPRVGRPGDPRSVASLLGLWRRRLANFVRKSRGRSDAWRDRRH